jgi:hypothetical protein
MIMVTPKRRTPAETWDALENMAFDDEVDRVLALSEEQLDEELKESGLDPQRVRERGRALGEQLRSEHKSSVADERPAPPPPRAHLLPREGVDESPPPRARVRIPKRVRWVAALAAALSATGIAMMSGPVLVGHSHAPSKADLEKAQELRTRAMPECVAGHWQGCLDGLNAADALDPDGESAEARHYREAAKAALHAGQGRH